MSALEFFYHHLQIWNQQLSLEPKESRQKRDKCITLLQSGHFESLITYLKDKPALFSSLFSANRYNNIQLAADIVLSDTKQSEFCRTLLQLAPLFPYITSLINGSLFDAMIFSKISNSDFAALKTPLIDRMKSMVRIPEGTFMMGALPNDEFADMDQKPQHSVQITRDFWMGRYPVTQGLYQMVVGKNPSHFQGFSRPVETVDWLECILFCNAMSESERLEPVYTLPTHTHPTVEEYPNFCAQIQTNWDANGYRLPTESEWEYAARGGGYQQYAGSDDFDLVGWFGEDDEDFYEEYDPKIAGNSNDQTHTVGQKNANAFGLYDIAIQRPN